MPGPLVAGIVGSVASAAIQSSSAKSAANAQTAAANQQIEETKRQFDLMQSLMRPYVDAGNVGLQYQLDLMGIGGSAGTAPTIEEFSVPADTNNTPFAASGMFGGVGGRPGDRGTVTATQGPSGTTRFRVGGREFATRAEAEAWANANRTGGVSAEDAQRAAIDRITNGAQFEEMVKQGEYGLLANASATGGLRGGDTQAAMAQFRPQMLQALIDQQLAQFGGIAANGQSAAAGLGGQAMNAAGMINQSLGDIGSAQAGRALASGQAWQNAGAGILNTMGQLAQPTTAGGGAWQKWTF